MAAGCPVVCRQAAGAAVERRWVRLDERASAHGVGSATSGNGPDVRVLSLRGGPEEPRLREPRR
jgi:hypothetical protein